MKIKYLCSASGSTFSSDKNSHEPAIRVRDNLIDTRFANLIISRSDGSKEVDIEEGVKIEWGYHDYYKLDNQWLTPKDIDFLENLGMQITKSEIVCIEADSSHPKRLYMTVIAAWNIIGAVAAIKYLFF